MKTNTEGFFVVSRMAKDDLRSLITEDYDDTENLSDVEKIQLERINKLSKKDMLEIASIMSPKLVNDEWWNALRESFKEWKQSKTRKRLNQ